MARPFAQPKRYQPSGQLPVALSPARYTTCLRIWKMSEGFLDPFSKTLFYLHPFRKIYMCLFSRSLVLYVAFHAFGVGWGFHGLVLWRGWSF